MPEPNVRGLIAALAFALTACSQSPPWSPTTSPAPVVTISSYTGTQSLTDVRMITPSVGWALAVPGMGHGLGHLVRTTDGGSHWTAMPLPSSLNTPNVAAVDFQDAMHAWLFVVLGAYSTASHEAAAVASTSDGGLHWTTTPTFTVDGAGTGVQFLDGQHGWVFATPSAGDVIGAGDTTLYRTSDGGRHWQAVKPPSEVRQNGEATAGLPEACPMGGPLQQPLFTSAQTGWLGQFCDRPFLDVTHDGGSSWSPVTLPAFPGPAPTITTGLSYNVDSFREVSANAFTVVVHRGVTTGANALQDAALYTTVDGGRSWRSTRLPAAELSDDFVDAARGWMIAAGPGGDSEALSLYGTGDGGRTWQFLGGPAGFYRQPVNFVDALTGFIAVPATSDSAPQFLRSTNGGKSWDGVPTTIG